MEKKKEKKIIISLIIVLILLDQIVKFIMILHGKNIVKDIENVDNIKYILLNIVAIIVFTKYMKSNNSYIKFDSKIIITFAIAGAVSNLIDRVVKGNIVNYINIPNFVSINLAYIYIAITWIGMAVILTKYTRNRLKENKIQNEIRNNSRKK